MLAYFNGQFLLKEEVWISPDDRGFLFGDGAYEVIRAYEGRLFRLDQHLRRLERSLRELRITGLDVTDLVEVAKALIVRNELEQGDASLYIEVTRGVASRKHAFPEARISPTVYLTVSPFRPSAEHWEHGVRTILVPDIRWARCDIKSVALLPNVLASQAASERGAQEALFIRDGVITEGAHTNVFAVFDGELRTHPATHHILDGISRQVVLELSQALGIPCREFPIFQQELGEADELLITGTTTEIKPVIEVDGRQVGYGRPGPITRKLQQAFRTIVSA